ncbi:MAG: glycosyltransferase family 2 protein [Lachnospiraceae bacterium]|nr:glycosyltransferase family 2 protein [Lachnospiraceae bacterium]
MKVSIIIPVFNKAPYVRECFDSLVGQTYPDIEIILTDDGSTDGSAEICDEYAAAHDNVISIHAHGEGPAAACKSGLEKATGDYVCFVDSDDWVDTDMIERLMEHATGGPEEMVLSDYVIERTDGSKTYVYQDIAPGEYYQEEIMEKVIPRLWGLEDRAVSQSRCMKLYSMDLARNNINYPDPDLKFAEDAAFLIPCVLDADRLYFLDHAAMYHYRFVNDSAVHRYTPYLTENITRVRSIIRKAISDKFWDEPETMERLLEDYRAESVIQLIFAIKNELRGDKPGYINKIRNLCKDHENAEVIREKPVRIKHPFNLLIYHTMKHPTRLNCRILRLLMDLHEK